MCFSSTCARLATSIWHDHQPDSPAREIVVSLQGTAVYWHAEPLARGGKVRRLHLLQPCWCPPSCNRYSNRTSAVREAVVRLVQRIEPTGSSRLDQVLNLARGATSAVFSPRGDLLAWTGPGSPGNRSSRSPRRQSNRDESLRGLPRDGRGNRSPQRPERTTPHSPVGCGPIGLGATRRPNRRGWPRMLEVCEPQFRPTEPSRWGTPRVLRKSAASKSALSQTLRRLCSTLRAGVWPPPFQAGWPTSWTWTRPRGGRWPATWPHASSLSLRKPPISAPSKCRTVVPEPSGS